MRSIRPLAVGLTMAISSLAVDAERAAAPRAAQPASRHDDAAAVLAADRAYSAQSAKTSFLATLSAMFRPDVIAPTPSGLLRGADAVLAALRAVPENTQAHVEWTPIGGGISADRLHGYTFGFMTARVGGGAATPLKYMAYWIRDVDGWKVVGYKRARRPEGAVSLDPLPLHAAVAVPAVTDAARLEALRRSLADAEWAFSDRAQVVGLGPAFVEFGAPSAVNMGGPSHPGFVVGNTAIGALIGAGAPESTSPVFWSSETVIVASSGDLGISFGYIKAHAPAPGAPGAPGAPEGGQPFFTIWGRAGATAPWRYVAE